LAFLAFFNFFLYSVDRGVAPPGHAVNCAGVRPDRIGKGNSFLKKQLKPQMNTDFYEKSLSPVG